MEDTRCVDKEQISQAARVITEVVKKSGKNDLTNPLEQQLISLQLGFKKIPGVRNKIIKIVLPNALVQKTTDICLFVKDLDASERDYDPTIRYFKDLLQSKGITRHIEVIPLKALKIEYQPYEAKRNLSNMFDLFLADERIMRILPKHLGKHFLSRKKYPISLNLTSQKLKEHFDKILSSVQCIISGKGSTCQVNVARTGMTPEQISHNLELAVTKLTNNIPGGVENVRNLHIKTEQSLSLPIFISLGKLDDVVLPKLERRNKEIEPSEITTVAGCLVKITKRGRVELVSNPEEQSAEVEELESPDEGSDDEEKLKKKKKKAEAVKTTRKSGVKRSLPEDDDDDDVDDDDVNDDQDDVKSSMKRPRSEDEDDDLDDDDSVDEFSLSDLDSDSVEEVRSKPKQKKNLMKGGKNKQPKAKLAKFSKDPVVHATGKKRKMETEKSPGAEKKRKSEESFVSKSPKIGKSPKLQKRDKTSDKATQKTVKSPNVPKSASKAPKSMEKSPNTPKSFPKTPQIVKKSPYTHISTPKIQDRKKSPIAQKSTPKTLQSGKKNSNSNKSTPKTTQNVKSSDTPKSTPIASPKMGVGSKKSPKSSHKAPESSKKSPRAQNTTPKTPQSMKKKIK